MISNELIQASVIAKLKANAGLTNWLTARNSTNEIRESQWQGAEFTYPAVRVEIGTQLPDGNLGHCHTSTSEIAFSIFSFSEDDSSKQADVLAGLVNAALFGDRLTGTGFVSLTINNDGLLHAVRATERVWRATGLYRMKLYESS